VDLLICVILEAQYLFNRKDLNNLVSRCHAFSITDCQTNKNQQILLHKIQILVLQVYDIVYITLFALALPPFSGLKRGQKLSKGGPLYKNFKSFQTLVLFNSKLAQNTTVIIIFLIILI